MRFDTRPALLSVMALALGMLPQLLCQNTITTGTVRGRVTDSTGALIPGASVQLEGQDKGATRTSKTNGAGLFIFPSLPVGGYLLKISDAGFRTVLIDNVVVQIGQTTSESIALFPGSADGNVTVSAATSALRLTESSLSSVVDRHLLDGLPLSGRRYTDFALLGPNASSDGQAGLVSFGGEQGGQDTGYANANGANAFTLDGASATSNYFGSARGGERVPYIFGENAIQEFQVTVSPYNAAYGGAATGFLNTVTRSGADAFHGDAFYYNRNSATGANDAIDKANGIPRPLNVLQQFGAGIGGPLLRQRAWFFFDYEQQRQKNPISSINTAYSALDGSAFGLPADTALPPPNADLPAPDTDSTPDANNAVYLQQVSNALHAIRSNLGAHTRLRNDLALFTKLDYQASTNDRLFLSLNLNRFNSPFGEITASPTAQFGLSALANSYVRDYHASAGWMHILNANLLSDFHASFGRDDQYASPAGLLPAGLPAMVLTNPQNFEIGNAGFANGRTNEAQWQIAERLDLEQGRHSLRLGFDSSRTHVTDSSFGGFDPDAQRQNGTFGGTYAFSSLSNFALGIYDSFTQSAGNPKFKFSAPYVAFYVQDVYQILPRLTLDLGVREDFQVYPQPARNPAFPLTGQFPNQYQRFMPRVGFAYRLLNSAVVRGGFGMFYENLNGLNYRNSVVSNGLSSQQSTALTTFNPDLAPNAQQPTVNDDGSKYGPVFPNVIAGPALFAASPNISIVSPQFRFPYILQSSLQIEDEILPGTTVSVGTMWTHGVHLIASSAYDLNLMRPTGTTTYIVCPPQSAQAPCAGRQITLPNLDTGRLQEGLISPEIGQINALISPGINHYNALFFQGQRQLRNGTAFQVAYTFAKNIASKGVDFNNQFDFSNTHSPYLLDQRHRLSAAVVYQPRIGSLLRSRWERSVAADWTLSSVIRFNSGRPYAALLSNACTSAALDFSDCSGGGSVGDKIISGGLAAHRGPAIPLDEGGIQGAVNNALNDTAFNQSTANSALGINGSGPSPAVGLNSNYGPWTQQIDLDLARTIHVKEHHAITLEAQAFNLFNHANYYVQNGTGVNQIQYQPIGQTCGDGQSDNQLCYLVPNSGQGGFKTLQSINALNGPRVLQFAFRYSF